ncbi:MAG: UvrD-helicase domain-containing protein [Crocinitomicaceae bacterium]|nr:UvrD-helicase domain-containing protein [Crocinitomicaceae bacterium]
MLKGKFLVLRSSAGSGKTYALVQHYLMLALSSGEPYYYSQILAITFTNAAAAEMKERIILRLKEFSEYNESFDSSSPLFQEFCEELKITPRKLRDRSKLTLAHILHHYSRFSVQTIDSFTHRIIRSFARDLRLNPDFRVEMESGLFLEKVIDDCIARVGIDELLTRYLVQFVIENFEDERNWDIRKSLLFFSKNIIREDSYEALETLSSHSPEDILSIRARLNTEKKEIEGQIKKLSNDILLIFHTNGIDASDLYYGDTGAFGFVKKMAAGAPVQSPASRFIKAVDEGWEKKKGKKELLVASLNNEVNRYAKEIIKLTSGDGIVHYRMLELAVKNIFSLGILSYLSRIANELREEQNLLLISDFQKKISEIVMESSAPFIYERVGERFNHILIDEFQDTSVMQWQNFIPLLENSLSKGHFNLLVGDGKQAIYRWRNGNAEQFIRLPEIPDGQDKGRKRLFKNAYELQILDRNYRSSKTIVSFNNALYSAISGSNSSLQETYSGHKQEAVRDKEGFVKVMKPEGETTAELRANSLKAITDSIKDCIASGYRYGDIAVLTRRGSSESRLISSALSEQGIRCVTKDSFLLSHSPKVRLVMAMLGWINEPSDSFRRFDVLLQTSSIFPDKYPLATLIDLYGKEVDRKIRFDTASFLRENFGEITSINLLEETAYTLAEICIRSFSLEGDAYLEFLIDHLAELSYKKEFSLSEIIQWWEEEKNQLSIASVPDSEAVQIMTIHKSKGLQFPVVVYPRFSLKVKESEIWIPLDKKKYGLPCLFAKGKAEFAAPGYPEEFAGEQQKNALDEINICYVATTRAEDRLYMILEQGRMTNELTKKIEDFLNGSEEKKNMWVFGSEEPAFIKDNQNNILIENISFSSAGISQSVRLRKSLLTRGIEWGEIVHEGLSHINTSSDIADAVNRMRKKHSFFSEEEILRLDSEIKNIVYSSAISEWFSDKYKVFTEAEFILPNGTIQRPDRVLIRDNDVIVIDFKTGLPRKSYHRQVAGYMNVLREIYQKPVKGFLAYTKPLKIEEVTHEVQ